MSVGRLHNIVKQFQSVYSFVRNMNSGTNKVENVDFDIELVNGLILCNYLVPEEIVIKVLSFVSWKDLLSCRLVCKLWKILIDGIVCLDKLRLGDSTVLKSSFIGPIKKLHTSDVPFYLCFAIGNNVFGINHLKNSFGEVGAGHTCRRVHRNDYWRPFSGRYQPPMFKNCSDDCPKFKHWAVTSSGGDGWIVEETPVGSQLLPANLGSKSCFVTSYNRCHKEQCIILKQCGLNNKIMDEVQPHIEVSEWYAKRFDCGIIYNLKVFLLNSEKDVVDHFSEEVEDREGDDEWHQVNHTFKDYGPGVRFVLFQHEGRDTQFWAGNYGSKMAGGAVIAKLDVSRLKRRTGKS